MVVYFYVIVAFALCITDVNKDKTGGLYVIMWIELQRLLFLSHIVVQFVVMCTVSEICSALH